MEWNELLKWIIAVLFLAIVSGGVFLMYRNYKAPDYNPPKVNDTIDITRHRFSILFFENYLEALEKCFSYDFLHEEYDFLPPLACKCDVVDATPLLDMKMIIIMPNPSEQDKISKIYLLPKNANLSSEEELEEQALISKELHYNIQSFVIAPVNSKDSTYNIPKKDLNYLFWLPMWWKYILFDGNNDGTLNIKYGDSLPLSSTDSKNIWGVRLVQVFEENLDRVIVHSTPNDNRLSLNKMPSCSKMQEGKEQFNNFVEFIRQAASDNSRHVFTEDFPEHSYVVIKNSSQNTQVLGYQYPEQLASNYIWPEKDFYNATITGVNVRFLVKSSTPGVKDYGCLGFINYLRDNEKCDKFPVECLPNEENCKVCVFTNYYVFSGGYCPNAESPYKYFDLEIADSSIFFNRADDISLTALYQLDEYSGNKIVALDDSDWDTDSRYVILDIVK